jgi:hypothetical protein
MWIILLWLEVVLEETLVMVYLLVAVAQVVTGLGL